MRKPTETQAAATRKNCPACRREILVNCSGEFRRHFTNEGRRGRASIVCSMSNRAAAVPLVPPIERGEP